MPPEYSWEVSRRHYRRGEHYVQIKKAQTFNDAVAIAKKWFTSHGVGYGIKIAYRVPEVWKWVTVRDYYIGVHSVEDIK